MKLWFRVSAMGSIRAVEVLKETNDFILIKGFKGKTAKHSVWEHYFDSLEAAQQFEIQTCESDLRVANNLVIQREKNLLKKREEHAYQDAGENRTTESGK